MCSPAWDGRCVLAPALAAALSVVPAAATAAAATATPVETEVAAATETTATAAAAAAAAEAATAAATAAATTAAEAAAAAATAVPAATTAKAAAAATTREGARLRLEAIAAVHRTVATGLEWNLCFFSARCAGGIEQLSRGTPVSESAAFSSAHCALPCPAAVRAAPGLARKALRRMKLLFTSGERERLAAIATDERLVGVRHPMTLLKLHGTYGH